ncbi:MAG TPA: M1 family aminopeptidase [Clostridia bacterium]|nr:M1 family aminopeptidase [Clostridia bacterium]
MKRNLLVSFLCLVASVASFGQRLPETAIPTHYNLTFEPDFATDTYKGTDVISVRVPTPTKTIVLNAVDIRFEDVVIEAAGKRQPAEVTLDPAKEFATLTTGQPIPAGAATISIKFTGTLNDKLRGLYLTRTKQRKYASTQFESTDARRAFPSFDEPRYKATFDLTVIADKGDTAISNGRIVSDTPGPGDKHTLKFSTTPKMSTYLVALMVGDWKCISDEQDGVPLRVCAVPGKEHLGSYALESTKHILKFFNQYYGIKYPFGKLDQIAVPDFEAGAMENTGAITYRETLLLADDKTTTENQKRLIFAVIAHEIAHQWFGNLVTMKWWDDIWLNEGFATWMAQKPMIAVHPEWNIDVEDVQESSTSMITDSVAAQRPIRQTAETRGEINELFDGIAYGKTAAVLRMLEAYVGPEAFRKGVNSYLKKHAYGNASAEDFWTEMARVTGKPFDKVLPTFINQAGVPFLDVKSSCAGGKTTVTVSQKRYYQDPALFQKSAAHTWSVPVCVKGVGANGASQQHCEMITQPAQSFTIAGCPASVFPNAGAHGYYRYNYDPAMLRQIKVDKDLTAGERLSLVANEWSLVRVGQHAVADYLGLMQAMKSERSRPILKEFSDRIYAIRRSAVSDDGRPAFDSFVRSFYGPIMQELGYAGRPNDTPEQKQIRAIAFSALGYSNDPGAVEMARKLTREDLEQPGTVEPSIATVAVNVAAWHGEAKLYDEYRQKIARAATPDEYYRYFGALAEFRDPALLTRTLEFLLSPEVRNQDLWLMASVVENPVGTKPGWEFVKTNYDALMKRLSVGNKSAVVALGDSFCSQDMKEDFANFIKAHPTPGSERRFKIATERIDACIDMRQRESRRLAEWLQKPKSAQAGAH